MSAEAVPAWLDKWLDEVPGRRERMLPLEERVDATVGSLPKLTRDDVAKLDVLLKGGQHAAA